MTLASKLYGQVKVAAINCQDEEELCEEFVLVSMPDCLVFTEDSSDKGERFNTA